MRNFLYLFLVFFLASCGTKPQIYTPKSYKKSRGECQFYSIKQTNYNFAKLSNANKMVFVNKDKRTIEIQGFKSYMLLSKNAQNLVLSDKNGHLIVLQNDSFDNVFDEKNSKIIYENQFSSQIILATLNGNYLAAINAQGILYAIDVNSGEILLEQLENMSLGQNAKLSPPIFLDNHIIYPTLDGKLVFFDINTKMIVGNLVIGKNDFFNNIIFLKSLNKHLIAISANNIIIMHNNNVLQKEINAQKATLSDKFLYVVDEDGDVFKFDLYLNEISKAELNFAQISDMIFTNNRLYMLEKTGYLISFDEDLKDLEVKKITNHFTPKSFATSKGFYFHRYFFKF